MPIKKMLMGLIFVSFQGAAQCPKPSEKITQVLEYNPAIQALEKAVDLLERYHHIEPNCNWQHKRNQLIKDSKLLDTPHGEQQISCQKTKTILPHYHARLKTLWSKACKNHSCADDTRQLFEDNPMVEISGANLIFESEVNRREISTFVVGDQLFSTITLKHQALNTLCGDATRAFLFVGHFPEEKDSKINKLLDSVLTNEEHLAKYDFDQGATYIAKQFDDVYFNLDDRDHLLYHDNHLLSMRHDSFGYTGGAHGFATSSIMTFDHTHGKKLSLRDIIDMSQKEAFLALAQKTFKKQMFIEGEGDDWESQGFWFGTEMLKDESKDWMLSDGFYLNDNFALVEKGLIFVYEPYEVSPWARGMSTLFLSTKSIGPFLKDNDILSSWLGIARSF